MFEKVTEKNVNIAAQIHSISWKESHKSFCSREFVELHTSERQKEYIQKEMELGKVFYMLVEDAPKGIVSVKDNMIENLYVLPSEQHKGYGTNLLQYAESLCAEEPTLWVLDNNKKAYSLYCYLGYQPTGRKKQLRENLTEIEMVHILDKNFD